MKNRSKRIAALLMAGLFTAGSIIPVNAAEVNDKAKEEVVYVNTDASGNVNEVNVVNIFGSGDVTDYGDYTSVKMLNTTDAITQDGDKIVFSTGANQAYYQGTMSPDTQIPWKIAITYELDGKKTAPEELAGKSGALTIHVQVEKNEACSGSFYDDYALQASFTLDTEHCSNIKAEGATLANVGADKQISYTVLPGKGLDAEISADVTDFEMDAVAVNGVQLSLNVDIDDEELMDKVREVMDATETLNQGAGSLAEGAKGLETGGGSLVDGMDTLYSGVSDLDNGMASLQTGVSNMQQGLNELNSKSATLTEGSHNFLVAMQTVQSKLSEVSIQTEQLAALTETSSAIRQGISDLYTGATQLQANLGYAQYKAAVNDASNGTLDVDALMQQNTDAVTMLGTQIQTLQGQISQLQAMADYADSAELQAQAAAMGAQIEELNQVITLLNGNNAAIGGVNTYLTSLSEGVNTLVNGLSDLKTSYEAFDSAIGTLVTNLGGMAVNMSQLSTAINTLVEQYGQIDSGITAYTGGVGTVVAGYEQLVNGVSTLASGSKDLLAGTGELKSGTSELYDGIVELCDGSMELSDGTQEFEDKTGNMDEQVQEKIDSILDSIGGDDMEVVSFVSDKNTNTTSVQFVIKTSEIKKAEKEPVVEEKEEQTGFGEKLLKLFGQ